MRKEIKERKKEIKTKFLSAILVFSILIIITFLLFSNWKIVMRRRELSAKIKILEGEIKALEEKTRQLESGIAEAEKQNFWEAKIREQGYKKPGETAVVIKKEQPGEGKEINPQNFWTRFLAEIKGILK